jgi:hypothetical protein
MAGWRSAQPQLVCAAAGAVVWLVVSGRVLPSSHSDTAMADNFRRHEAEFRRLVQMSDEDQHVWRIAPDFTQLDSGVGGPSQAGQLGLAPERWKEYRALFEAIGVTDGIVRGPGQVRFYYWATGMVTGGTEKGYVFSPAPLAPLVDTLDHLATPAKSREPVYMQIAPDWYLYYGGDD